MITLTGLTKRYGDRAAVADLSFAVGRGEVFGLLGPNGAGKSTTIKMLTLLAKPSAGTASVDGLSIERDGVAIKRRISVVPQENNLDRELTAGENLEIYSLLHSVPQREEKIRACLELVDLRDRRDDVVGKFSGGMQRRLLIARALLTEPAVLFLDEPSIGLDPQIRRGMWDIIRKTRIDGRTVLITTHYIEEAEALCDRVGILAKGRLIALDTPPALKARVGEHVVEHVNAEGKLVQQICRTRDEAHALARQRENGVTVRKTNLEDVFIKLTGERIE
jgi:ABC-2 type transport system ATP-binding protein